MYAAEHARLTPNKPALIMAGSGETVTFAEYEARANQLAHLFRDLGLHRGDHVAQFLENHVRYPELAGAAERTGLYYTCINSHLSLDEAAYIVNDSQAQVLVSSAARGEIAEALPALCPNVKRFLMVGGSGGRWESYEAALAAHPTGPVADESLGGSMLYSSGTTGRPKGILKPLNDADPAGPLLVVQMTSKLFGFREGMTYLSPAPLYHAAPQIALGVMLRSGATTVVMERFDPEAYLQAVEQYRVTHTQVVPTMLARLLKLPAAVRDRYDISSLESVVHAGAPCPIAVKEAAMRWLGPIVSEYYGATEGHGLTWCGPQEWLEHKGSVGRAVLGQIEIRDEAGAPCPVGTPGLVWFRGATGFEYFNDAEKTKSSRDASGTASTVGDVGYLDQEGYLYLTDRLAHMIISGGVNIYPQETENILASHPKVADVAIIGAPNEDLGEEVKAVVQVEPDIAPGEGLAQELIAYCRDHLAHYKCPRSVDFVEELPRLPTGKLAKHLLKEKYWKGRTLVG